MAGNAVSLAEVIRSIDSRTPSALASDGSIKASLQSILGSAFTEGAGGRIAAAFKQFFNIASPAATMDHGVLTDTTTTATTATNLTNAPTNGDFTSTMKTSIATAISGMTLFTGITQLSHWLGMLAGKQSANATALTEIKATGGGSGTYDPTTDSLEANRDNIGTAGAGLTSADDAVITAVAALSIPTANANADALLDRSAGVETSYTLRQALRVILSAAAGKLSGGATTTNTFRDVNDTKDRIVATVDDDGNRTAVTLDVS